MTVRPPPVLCSIHDARPLYHPSRRNSGSVAADAVERIPDPRLLESRIGRDVHAQVVQSDETLVDVVVAHFRGCDLEPAHHLVVVADGRSGHGGAARPDRPPRTDLANLASEPAHIRVAADACV